MRFDAQQGFMKRRTLLLQMRSRPRPFRYDSSEQVECADLIAAEIRMRREEIGEHFPVPVQARPCAGADALQRRFVGILAPALWKIDDADGGVAVGCDEHEPADRLG